MKLKIIHVLGVAIITSSAIVANAEEEALDAKEAAPAVLNKETVARINGQDVPYEWFLHEFRSTFFKFGNEPDIRSKVFDSFLEKMILHQTAVDSGVTKDDALVAEIKKRLEGMEAYMKFQLAMTEQGMIVDHYLKSQNITREGIEVTEDEVKELFESEFKTRPGAPATFEEIPPFAIEQLKDKIRTDKFNVKMKEIVETARKDLSIDVNKELVDSVPMPEMKGRPPMPMGGGKRPVPRPPASAIKTMKVPPKK